MSKYPIYRLTVKVNPKDPTRIEYNALVDRPAHSKKWEMFDKQEDVRGYFVEDKAKQIVRGVMVSANTLIYRNDKEIGPHYVFFDAETIEIMRDKFMREQRGANVNEMHNPRRLPAGVFMVESYLVDRKAGLHPPVAMEKMNLQEGTWIASYKITNPALWRKVQAGTYQGFSVEGLFDRTPVNVKSKTQKMSKTKTSVLDRLLGRNRDSFASVTTVDGATEIYYEGELTEGAAVFVEVDGAQVPAPEGSYDVSMPDGGVKTIAVDANGVVTSVTDAEEFSEADTIREEVAEAIEAVVTELQAEFQEQIDALRAEFAGEKPGAKPEAKKPATGNPRKPVVNKHRAGGSDTPRKSYKDLLKNKKD